DHKPSCSAIGVATVGLCSSKVVLEANDIVFAEIVAALHFDEDQIFFAGVLNAVGSADGNVDRLAGTNRDLTTVERDLRRSADDEPVFRTLRVLLITQSFSGQHFDPFDLESGCFFQHLVSSPRTSIEFSHWFWSFPSRAI